MERERELMQSYAELSRLNRERAIEEERARLVRDMHDGLGSQLFTSLARVQRTAPVSTNLILAYLAEHVLGLPRSY